MIRALVLGGKGFIGSHLVDSLISHNYIVRCFDRPHVIPLSETRIQNERFEFFEGDLVSEVDISEALQGIDVCFHLISTTMPKSSNSDPAFDVETNLLGTVKLLTHAVKAGVKKIIFISSGGTVYGPLAQVPVSETHPNNPTCSYGITKLAIEKYLELFHQLHGLEYSVLRIANPFGERQRTIAGQGAVAVFLGKAMRGEKIDIWGNGSIVRDYIYINDVITALHAITQYSGHERIFNIGSGRGLSLNEVLDAIENVTGKPTIRNYISGRPFDVPANVLDITRAKSALSWSPRVPFEEGLTRFNNWLKLQPDIN